MPALEAMLLPGKNRELFLITSENKSDNMFGELRVQNVIVIDEGENELVTKNIICIDTRETLTINIFDQKKGTWMFQTTTDSLELEKYL